jgi:prepilin-type processing-associated H-X9-DG protein
MQNQEASQQDTQRRPITLIEVIVVVIVLALVVAVLLPANSGPRHKIHKRVECLNQLRQLALACHNYQTTRKGRFPAGTIIDSAEEPEKRLSFLVLLLPYVEQEPLYKRMDRTAGWEAGVNRPSVSTPLSVFRCPADLQRAGPQEHITNYVGLAGAGSDAATLTIGHPRAGVFGYDRQANINIIEDGASNTLLFIETVRDNGPWAAGGPPTIRFVDTDDPTPIAKDGSFGLVHHRPRWPWQEGEVAANVAMVDGSVHTLHAKVSGKILAALATMAGAELIPNW